MFIYWCRCFYKYRKMCGVNFIGYLELFFMKIEMLFVKIVVIVVDEVG